MAWIRERVYRSFIDALPLTDTRKSEIASTIGLYNQYLDIWTDFTVLLLDNTCLNEKQKNFIYTYLNLLPGGIHNLRSISVADYLGHTSPEVPLWGLEGGVNIFGVDIGGYSENSFPDDVPPGMVDGFCIVVAHEINHVVDAFYIQNNNTLRDRKDKLIADAGDEHLNYLRSMFPDGFFQQYPQEFFASIANQWFTDSKKTIELGIVRFDNVSKYPINQALFFADIYSLGRNFTYFYTIDTQGNITRHKIPLSRDANSRINSLTIGDLVYTFTLDANGEVTAYSIQPVENKSPVASFTHSPANPLANQTLTFDASNSSDPDGYITSYEWDFGDGNIANTTGPIITHSYASAGDYIVNLTVTDDDGATNSTFKQITVFELEEFIFDTGSPSNPYPSIMGTHTGTIKPNHTVIATKLYTYPCEGTGGHTEYARIWNKTWNATATWDGYEGDWHNITFDKTVVLLAGETYFYEIRTGSYPQIHHNTSLLTPNGWINCTEFVDANGKVYYDWIPAIKLE